ncbi:hypothetical protein [Nocardia sp. NPDC002869]|uniref:hypothetical protein n=1 Tax=Nocardia sp. NPDC002869 TaxID=3161032 RepID=UPI00398CAB08
MDSQLPLRSVVATIDQAYPGDALERLSEAASNGADWLQVADRLLDHVVGRARRAGLSWAEIGTHLGVSRQAAQQRFADRAGENPETTRPMRGAPS